MDPFSFDAEAEQNRVLGIGKSFESPRRYDVTHCNGNICFIRNGAEPKVVARATAETTVVQDGLRITLGGRKLTYYRYTGNFRCSNQEEAERLHQFLVHAIAQLARPQVDPVGDALPPIEDEPAQYDSDDAPQEARVPSDEEDEGVVPHVPIRDVVPEPGLPPVEEIRGVPIPLENGPLPPVLPRDVVPEPVLPPPENGLLQPVPPRLAELPGFVDEWRTGHMSPSEAKRMFCTLFAAYIVRVTGNPNHQDRYNEMINGSVVDTDKLTQPDTKCIIEAGPAALAVMSHF